jgi:hypothetical protein
MIIRTNAHDLERLIKKTYKRDFRLPQRLEGGKTVIEVTSLYEDQEEDVENFKNGLPIDDHHLTLEALMADLCDKGKLEEGEHLVECTD